MQIKKNPKADLEKSKTVFAEAGLIIALVLAIVVIESSVSRTDESMKKKVSEIEIELLTLPVREKKEKPKRPKPKTESNLRIISDTMEIKDSANYNFDFEIESEYTEPEEPEDREIIQVYAADRPEFRGGAEALRKYYEDSLRYPPEAIEKGIQGRVYVSFVIGKSGAVTNIRILKSAGEILDREALRFIKNMPPWKPASVNGKKISMQFTLPVIFVLKE